jgi:hypothetical protein
LIFLLIETAYGFAGMGGNTTTIPQVTPTLDLKNTTELDPEIQTFIGYETHLF